jgi:hypothetical protein
MLRSNKPLPCCVVFSGFSLGQLAATKTKAKTECHGSRLQSRSGKPLSSIYHNTGSDADQGQSWFTKAWIQLFVVPRQKTEHPVTSTVIDHWLVHYIDRGILTF